MTDDENRFKCLLGSNIQPSVFINASGKMFTLGEVVAEAHTRSGKTVEEWNEWCVKDEAAQEAAIQAVVDEWGLKPEEQEAKIGDGYSVKAIKADTPPAVRPSATHTYAELEISRAAYDEIKGLLEAAGYSHAFMDDGAIDMHGIGLTKPKLPPRVDIFINGTPTSIDTSDGTLSYEDIYGIVYPERGPEGNPSCTWSIREGGSGILSRGQSIPLEPGLRVSMIDTGNA